MAPDSPTQPPSHGQPYRPGNRAHFDRLYEATYQRIFQTLVAMIGDLGAAEDCTQTAFLHAFKAWDRWNVDTPAEAWLHRIAINTAIAYKRKHRLLQAPAELVRRLGVPETRGPQAAVPDTSALEELRRLLGKQAAALVLRYLHGYSNREIGVALGVPESTVGSRLMDARKALRARLKRRTRPYHRTFLPPLWETAVPISLSPCQ